MRKLRVAIIRQRYRPDGGAERFVSRALEALGSEGVELTVFAREWSGDGSFKVVRCDPRYGGRVARESSFAKAVCETLKQHSFDLVQSHERVPCGDIYRAGDGVHLEWLRQRSRVQGALKNWFQKASGFHRYMLEAERALFSNPALRAVICNSTMVKEEIIQNFAMEEHKIHVIYNGLNTATFHPNVKQLREEFRRHHGIAEETPCFLFVGSGFERKGLAFAIKALAQGSQAAHLLVVGKDKNQRAYEKLARRLGIGHRVRFFGVQQDVAPFYGMADAFLFPTLYDPFPNVILEAMACGLPVITATKCGGAEFVTNGVNGFVADALDEDRLAQAVTHLEEQPRAKRMGQQARLTAEGFSADTMAQQLISLYRDLLT